MRKPIRHHYKRPYPRRPIPHWLGFLPSLVVLILISFLYSHKDGFHLDNGSGGADWRIGKPQATMWNASPPRKLPELRAFALKLINRDRQINGLSPLVEDPLLAQAAQLHAEDMKTRNYYNHVTPEGKTPTDRFAAIGGQGGVGENIMFQPGSFGSDSTLNWALIEKFQKVWMYSNGHRKNLLTASYTKVGYGIVSDSSSGKMYAVQKFQ
ncbi:CAP domain-containing protein [Leptolyngbya sp. FACHB-1624]|nr:CAP domain-containing protein [Leptolyngbya sp. FACHB-1624]